MTAKASVGRKQRGKGFKEDLKASRVISNSIGHIVGDIGKAGIKVLYRILMINLQRILEQHLICMVKNYLIK